MFATLKAKKELFLASSLCDGVEDNNLKQVTTLLDNKEADPNVIIPIYGITPFHLAVGNPSESFAEEVTKLFLRHGGNPNVRSTEGLTPVHVAAAWGRCKVLELLLSNGGDPLLLDEEGYNPFHFAFDGVHYDAVDILRKYYSDSTDEEEELKYDIALEKLFINNKNIVAEYVVSDDQINTSSFSSENFLEANIKSEQSSSALGSQILLNDDFVTRRRYKNAIQKENLEGERTLDRINAVTGEKSREEKRLVSQIINRLSTSLTNDITKADLKNNSDPSLYERRMQVMPKVTKSVNHGRQLNQPGKLRIASSENLNRGRLKMISKELRSPVKAATTLIPGKVRRNSPYFKIGPTALDHSIVSKSPNCKIPSPSEIKKTLEHSPTVGKHSVKALDNSIVSKSPNCAIVSSLERKRKLGKTSSFEKQVTPKIVKKPQLKMISRTPCEFRNKISKSNSQYSSQISKSVPRNFHKISSTVSQKREPILFKKPMSVNKKMKSDTKVKDTDDSSGVYSSLSKQSDLNNAVIKLENHLTEDFDSLSSKSDVQSTRISDRFEQETDEEEKYLNTSLENKCSQFSKTNTSGNLELENLSEGVSYLKYNLDNRDTRLKDNSLDCSQESKPNLTDNALLSMSKLKVENKVRKFEYSLERRNIDSLISEDLTKNFLNRPEFESFVSVEEEYKYKDLEEGVVLMERRHCITPSCLMVNKEEQTSFYTCSTAESVSSLPQEMLLIDKQTLRKRLEDLGEKPGPITNSTHRVYLKRLMKLEDKKQTFRNASPSLETSPVRLETDSIKSSLLSLNWQKDLESYRIRENEIFEEFARPDPSRRWREGLAKASFNYLLLDSRITNNLPNRASDLSLKERWVTFLSAIFYVGKGKRSRPYAHLYDAFHMWVSKKPVDVSNKKIKRILEIWNEKQGVVVLHIFHNIIPVEAYTREAVMIDALGVEKLGNCKGGEYYGVVSTWSNKEKCELGKYLLYKAMEILMVEGERHLFPEHL